MILKLSMVFILSKLSTKILIFIGIYISEVLVKQILGHCLFNHIETKTVICGKIIFSYNEEYF